MARQIKPFVKWAGGKTQLLDRLKERMPIKYNNYYEPFIGGGALLLDLQPEKAFINDINEQLINCYMQLKDNTDDLINEIRAIETENCDKDYYLYIRDRYNKQIEKGILNAETAGLMIWINKHCFNGLYRVNKKGLFNVPYNNNKNANSISLDNLLGIAEYLKTVDIKCMDFEEAVAGVGKEDFVYFDSPYIPESKTANFTSYTKDKFEMDEHIRLANLFKELDSRGAYVMLSNNDVDLVYELYNGYNIDNVDARRFINRDANKRKGKEVIITNY